jgi:hypothetical protein
MKSVFARMLWTLLLIAVLHRLAVSAETARYRITVDAGEFDRVNVPVFVDLALPSEFANTNGVFANSNLVRLTKMDGREIEAQFFKQRLWFVLDKLPAGEKLTLEATVSKADRAASSDKGFAWKDTAGKHTDLVYDGRPLLRYMYVAPNASSPERRGEPYHAYHHVFDPAGKMLVTKGPGGRFLHHRGLFFGFNRVQNDRNTYNVGKLVDNQRSTGKAYQSHEGFLASEAGPVFGSHSVHVGWHGQEDGEIFGSEFRALTVYRQPRVDGKPKGTLIDFASVLAVPESRSDINDNIDWQFELDGDPQHSGFYFCASNEVAEKTKGQTYFLRPSGMSKPGEYLSTAEHRDQVNPPWKGMSFVVGGERFTAVIFDRPKNPKEVRFSEHDDGQFGAYFAGKVTEYECLQVSYRFWLQTGEMTIKEIEAMAKDFTDPPVAVAERI